MKKQYFSVLTIIMALALYSVILSGCGQSATPPVESAKPSATASPTISAAAMPDAVTSATYDNDKPDSVKPAAYNSGKDDTGTTTASGAAAATDIGADEAKKIALEHAGVAASDVTFTKTEKSCDDKGWEYELAFCSESNRYDYEIDACTGAIRSYGHTQGHYGNLTTDANGNTEYMDIDAAKAIALEHAGLSETEVTFTKAKLENDHGYMEYEFKFHCNGTKYEYTIDASSGDVIDFETGHKH